MATDKLAERGPPPYARCIWCHVGFEVPDHVWAEGYREVRCGACKVKFDLQEGIDAASGLVPGKSQMSDDEQATQTPIPTLSESLVPADDKSEAAAPRGERYWYDDREMDDTVTDFDLHSEETELPEVAYLEDTGIASPDETGAAQAALLQGLPAGQDTGLQATPVPSAGSPIPVASETSSLQAIADAIDGTVTSAVIEDVPPLQPLVFDCARSSGERPVAGGDGNAVALSGALASKPGVQPTSREPVNAEGLASGGWKLLLASMLAAMVVLAGGAGAWLSSVHDRPAYYNSATWRPAVELSCRVAGCSVPVRFELDKLTLLQRNVFSHPTLADALVLNVSVRNEAQFAQRYPILVVRFSDTAGRTVARRNFAPEDYLEEWQPGDTIAAGRRLDINLEIDDPGEAAGSFELDFRAASG